jgi:hypothetical protein
MLLWEAGHHHRVWGRLQDVLGRFKMRERSRGAPGEVFVGEASQNHLRSDSGQFG